METTCILEPEEVYLYFNISEDATPDALIWKYCTCGCWIMDAAGKVWFDTSTSRSNSITYFKVINNKTGTEWNFSTNIYDVVVDDFVHGVMPNSYLQSMYRRSKNPELFVLEKISESISEEVISAPFDVSKMKPLYQDFFNLYNPARMTLSLEFLNRICSQKYKPATMKLLIKRLTTFNEHFPGDNYHTVAGPCGGSAIYYRIYKDNKFIGFMDELVTLHK